MKIAVFSDIHDNLTRFSEAAEVIKAAKVQIGICCGDVTSIDTLIEVAATFKKVYLALGNGDYKLLNASGLIPENVKYFESFGAFELEGKNIAIVHKPTSLDELAATQKYDVIFYGHTHTPWEKQIGKTKLLNPGEVAGHFGTASFCIFDLDTLKGSLKILK